MRAILVVSALALAGCSSGSAGTLTNTNGSGAHSVSFDGGDPDATPRDTVDAGNYARPMPDGAAPPTWSYLYATYFGPGTLGHCGDSGCHLVENNHFACGDTKESCYQGLLMGSFINPTTPSASRLTDPERTPLSWFPNGGGMPYDKGGDPNPTAADEIAAWVFAGAKDN